MPPHVCPSKLPGQAVSHLSSATFSDAETCLVQKHSLESHRQLLAGVSTFVGSIQLTCCGRQRPTRGSWQHTYPASCHHWPRPFRTRRTAWCSHSSRSRRPWQARGCLTRPSALACKQASSSSSLQPAQHRPGKRRGQEGLRNACWLGGTEAVGMNDYSKFKGLEKSENVNKTQAKTRETWCDGDRASASRKQCPALYPSTRALTRCFPPKRGRACVGMSIVGAAPWRVKCLFFLSAR